MSTLKLVDFAHTILSLRNKLFKPVCGQHTKACYLRHSSSNTRRGDDHTRSSSQSETRSPGKRITKPFYHFVDRYKNIVEDLEAPVKQTQKKQRDAEAKLRDRERYRKSYNKPHYRRPSSLSNIKGHIIYGKFPVNIALNAKRRDFHKLFMKSSAFDDDREEDVFSSIIENAEKLNIPVEKVSRNFLDQLVRDPIQGVRQHQGICADVSPLCYQPITSEHIIDARSGEPQLWLLVQSVQDPNNFGALLRSAYFLGVERVVAHNSCALSAAVSKVSAGALEVLDVHETHNMELFIQACKHDQWQVVGTGSSTEQHKSVGLHDVETTKNTLLVIGNEGEGMSEGVEALCDAMISIPHHHVHTSSHHVPNLHSAIDSLNVSVATGIIIHQLKSRRKS